MRTESTSSSTWFGHGDPDRLQSDHGRAVRAISDRDVGDVDVPVQRFLSGRVPERSLKDVFKEDH